MIKKVISVVTLITAVCAFMGCDGDGGSEKKETSDECVSIYCKDGELVQPVIKVASELESGVQVSLSADLMKSKTVIEVDGWRFKDSNGNGVLDDYEDWRLSAKERATALVNMEDFTLEQKTALLGIGGGSMSDDGSVTAENTQGIEIQEGVRFALLRMMGGFGTAKSPENVALWMNNTQAYCESSSHGLCFVMWCDPESYQGGESDTWTRNFPSPMGMVATNDPNVARQYADCVREEYMAVGMRGQYGPLADCATEPRWTRWETAFGDAPEVTAEYTRQVIKGFQNDGDTANGIAAIMKHFPGHGPQQDGEDPHQSMMGGTDYRGEFLVYPGGQFESHLIPFKAAIEEGAMGCMPCYAATIGIGDPEQVSSCYSTFLINDLLRDELGFDGMITADWGATGNDAFGMKGLPMSYYCAKFLEAGSDQLDNDGALMKTAYEEGFISMDQINVSAIRCVEFIMKLGLMENPYVDVTAAVSKLRTEKNVTNAKNAQKKSIVLLKNETKNDSVSLPFYNDGDTYSKTLQDQNGDGLVKIWYNGTDPTSTVLQDTQYVENSGVTNISFTADLSEADFAVARFQSVNNTKNGIQDLRFTSMPSKLQSAIEAQATNTNLKIIAVMEMGDASIIAGGEGGIDVLTPCDAFLVDFSASDTELLEVLFKIDFEDFTSSLPTEICSSQAAAEEQFEDVGSDSFDPTFARGFGKTYSGTQSSGGGGWPF